MRIDYITPGSGSNVYKLGFKYAIKFNSQPPDFREIIDRLTLSFGEPSNRRQYYNSHLGLALSRPRDEPRWFVGPKHWGASKQPRVLRRAEHWIVFRTEKDRLIASMMI
jgi:hypothetical protein